MYKTYATKLETTLHDEIPISRKMGISVASYDGHARLLLHMRGCLVAAAGDVQPGHAVVAKHTQRVHAFRGNVYAAVCGGCTDKEYLLLRDELDMVVA